MTPAVIDVDPTSGFDSIPTGEILALLDASGAVVFRGAATPDTLDRLSRRFCDRFTCDPGKVVTGGLRGRGDTLGRAARVAARSIGRVIRRPVGDRASQQPRYAPFGGFGINPHSENAFLPAASPDLVWFLCERPADSGGDTILADGAEVLERLDADTAAWLDSEAVRYETLLTESQWRSVWPGAEPSDLRTRLDALPGVQVADAAAGGLTITYDATQLAVARTGERVVRTNLLSRHPFGKIGVDHDEQTADGRPVDRAVLERVLAATKPFETVRLEAGEILVIDNTRVMHGRTRFNDQERRVVTTCGWLRDELVAA